MLALLSFSFSSHSPLPIFPGQGVAPGSRAPPPGLSLGREAR